MCCQQFRRSQPAMTIYAIRRSPKPNAIYTDFKGVHVLHHTTLPNRPVLGTKWTFNLTTLAPTMLLCNVDMLYAHIDLQYFYYFLFHRECNYISGVQKSYMMCVCAYMALYLLNFHFKGFISHICREKVWRAQPPLFGTIFWMEFDKVYGFPVSETGSWPKSVKNSNSFSRLVQYNMPPQWGWIACFQRYVGDAVDNFATLHPHYSSTKSTEYFRNKIFNSNICNMCINI